MSKFTILCPRAFDYILNKTGNMLIRYRPKEVCSIIDPDNAGKKASDILGYGGEIPIVKNFKDSKIYSPDSLVIGNAPQGGVINEDYKEEIKKAISFGCDIYNGMHQFLKDDPHFSELAKTNKVKIYDLRRPPHPPHFPKGLWKERKAKVLLVVGTDCDTGKMTTAWEITRRLKKRGRRVEFIGTGQTGILLGKYGIPIDAVVADFMVGETEFIMDSISNDTELIIVEGQGSISNMYYAGVTLGLMHGAMPDYLVLTHELGRELDVCNNPIPSIKDTMDIYISLMKNFKKTKFLGINLITLQTDEDQALKEIDNMALKYNLPVTDLVRFGSKEMIEKIEKESF